MWKIKACALRLMYQQHIVDFSPSRAVLNTTLCNTQTPKCPCLVCLGEIVHPETPQVYSKYVITQFFCGAFCGACHSHVRYRTVIQPQQLALQRAWSGVLILAAHMDYYSLYKSVQQLHMNESYCYLFDLELCFIVIFTIT